MSFDSAFTNMTIKYVEDYYKTKVLAIFSYGSAVYKNKIPSDLDYIVITEDKCLTQSSFDIDGIEIQLTFYTLNNFKELLSLEEISILECIGLNNAVNKDSDIELIRNESLLNISEIMLYHKINLKALRSSISSKSSNSYVKAKKKIIVSDDFDLGTSLKSLWHSFRIMDFGIQLAKNGVVTNYKSVNLLYNEIKIDYDNFKNFETKECFWDFIHNKYKPRYNNLTSEFKKLAPK